MILRCIKELGQIVTVDNYFNHDGKFISDIHYMLNDPTFSR